MTTQLQKESLIRIVDDEAMVRNALAFMLGCRGWKTACYDSAEAYLNDLKNDTPGCLLLDIRMPGMSGVELCLSRGLGDVYKRQLRPSSAR